MAVRALQRVWVLRMGNNASATTAISNTAIANQIKDAISDNCVVIFSKSTCSYCKMAKKLFQEMNVNYKAIELDRYENGSQFQDILHQMTGSRTVPRIFINGNFVGGATDTQQLHREGKLLPLVHQCQIQRERNSVHSKLGIGKLVYQTEKVKRDLDNTKIRRWNAGAQIKQSLEREKLNSA